MRKTEDISGNKYGILEVIKFHDFNKGARFLCKCQCGNEKLIRAYNLKNGFTKSCGCASHPLKSTEDITDLIGTKSDRLIVKEFSHYEVMDWPSTKGKKLARIQIWKCECSCGRIHNVSRSHLISKAVKSCGCLDSESRENRYANYKKHGICDNGLEDGEAAWNVYYSVYKSGATRRELFFDIPINDFKSICLNNCKYCGITPSKLEPSLGSKIHINSRILVNGIDRVDNNLGYTSSNCVTCCSTCNYAKRNLSIEEWNRWIERLVIFNRSILENNTNDNPT